MTLRMAAAPALEADDRSGLRHAAFLLDRGIGLVTESVGAADPPLWTTPAGTVNLLSMEPRMARRFGDRYRQA